MTTTQLHQALQMELDKQPTLYSKAFLPSELDYFLNTAYISLINQKLTGHNTLQSGFEGSLKISEDLRPLLHTLDGLEESTSVTSDSLNSIVVTVPKETGTAPNLVPTDVLYIVDVKQVRRATDDEDTVDHGTVQLRRIPHESVKPFLQNDENYPWIPNPVYTVRENNLYIYLDPEHMITHNASTFSVTYLKKPATIVNTSGGAVIEIQWTNELVQLAASLALENVESQRVQTQFQLTTQTNQ